MIQNAGSQFITADSAVGTSGKPTRVFAINFVSGATAGIVIIRNGTSTSGTAYVTENGVISSGKTVEYGTPGVLFPAGCYADVDVNVTALLVTYSQESSA